MAGGNKKIHEHPNAGKNDFSKRPNEAGAKRKLYSEHISDIEKLGYKAPTKAEYFDMIGLLVAMEESDIKSFSEDTTRPYWIRLIIMDLSAKHTRQKMMSDYRDWLFGKAQQAVDHTSKGEKIQQVVIELPPEDNE